MATLAPDLVQLLEAEQAASSPPPASAAEASELPVEVVAKTRAEAARLLEVDERTISRWANEPEFPGKSGTPGKQDGYFPIGAIKAWKQSRDGTTTGSDVGCEAAVARLRNLQASAVERELRIAEKQRQLIEVDVVISRITTMISTARSILEELPDAIVEAIPAKFAKTRKRALRFGRRKVALALDQLADLRLLGSADDEFDDADQASSSTASQREGGA